MSVYIYIYIYLLMGNCHLLVTFILKHFCLEEAQENNDTGDKTDVEIQSDAEMQSDTTRLNVTAPVTSIPEDIAVDIANNASTGIVEIVLAKPVVEDMATEMTNCHNNTCSETPEAPFPGPVAMETTCQSPADGAVASPSNPHDTASQEHFLYQVKWINFNDTSVGIITQNENGSCPLLAVVNILTLQGKIKLPPTLEVVSSGQLMEYLADCIFEQTPPEVRYPVCLSQSIICPLCLFVSTPFSFTCLSFTIDRLFHHFHTC